MDQAESSTGFEPSLSNSATQEIIPNGPYKLSDISIQAPDIGDDATITCMECWENNLYIGTSKGEVIHMYQMDEQTGFIQISKQFIHETKRNPVRKIIVLSTIFKVAILFGAQLTCMTLPELSPANIGKVKNINDLNYDWADLEFDDKGSNKLIKSHSFNDEQYCELVAFTNSSIRTLRIFKDSIRLHKEIPFNDVIKIGVQNKSFVAIAMNNNQFNLVDVQNSKMIPLFPIFTNPESHVIPKIEVLNKEEFLLICGGDTQKNESIGMCINTKGDITRTTLTWEEYPSQLIVDFPYIISSNLQSISLHSLHEQKKIDNIPFENCLINKIQKVFKIKDSVMIEKGTIGPLISSPDNVEDMERITIEFDKANKKNYIESSIIVCDNKGSNFKLLRPISKYDRWLKLYSECSKNESAHICDKLIDELNNMAKKSKFLITLVGLFCLKFQISDHLFEIWVGNYKVIDPRILIYLMDKDIEFKTSVWTYNGLFNVINQLRTDLVKSKELYDFFKLYLCSCLNLEFDQKEILKTVEIAYLKQITDDPESLENFIHQVKYSQNETAEVLLLNKKYHILTKVYANMGQHTQYLYYMKGLITGQFRDPTFTLAKEKSIPIIVDYISNYCSDDYDVVWKYLQWLLEEYPHYALSMLKNKKFTQMEFNDLNIMHLIKGDVYQFEYLKMVVEIKNERLFIPDLIISAIKNLVTMTNDDTKESFKETINKYQRISIPRLNFENYWGDFKPENNQCVIYHDLIIFYMKSIKTNSKPLIIGDLSKTCLENMQALLTEYKEVYPLIFISMNKIQGDFDAVVDILCDLGDFIAAEDATNGDQKLLKKIFEQYLTLGKGELIDRFLLKYDTTECSDSIEMMDAFINKLHVLPDSIPISELKCFLTKNLIECDESLDKSLRKVELERSKLQKWNRLL